MTSYLVGCRCLFLVVGLGNPGMRGTRHNAGQMAVDFCVDRLGLSWSLNKSLSGWVAETRLETVLESAAHGEGKLYFFKPKEYMNLSGGPVKKAVATFRIQPSCLVVCHDDLERQLGKLSIKEGGSAGGHNGVRSIIQALGLADFARLRIGIDRPADKGQVQHWVLARFPQEQQLLLEDQVWPLFLKQIGIYVKGNAKRMAKDPPTHGSRSYEPSQ
ncbi:peptidyl-tRNA hydrolase protein 1 [Kappamyces sp. JEL0829]|nr:peptidyl-tRNA hydrolase protein 1 [Kappamyces sp. JEL0829]